MQDDYIPTDDDAPDAPPKKSGRKLRDATNDPPKPKPDWTAGLLRNTSNERPRKNIANVLTVLSQHPDWRGVIGYDEFAEAVVKLKAPPTRKHDAIPTSAVTEWTHEDTVRTCAWMSSQHEDLPLFDISADMVDAAVPVVAQGQTFHPVRAWLSDLRWDGQKRVHSWLQTYFGAEVSDYSAQIGERWLISAVARVFEPGCQADCMIILEGAQGLGKSTGLEILAGREWFADTGIRLGDKDSYQALRKKWIYEFGELSSLKKSDVETFKTFTGARADNYRASYARKNRDYPRQCVFAGTTNEDHYLRDATGNRRFWPVKLIRPVDRDAIARDRAQLWAEAVALYESKVEWHVNTPELLAMCQEEQAKRRVPDDWMDIVRPWLEHPSMPGERRDEREPIDPNEGITTGQALIGALGFEASRIQMADSMRMGSVLRDLGWESRQLRRAGGRPRLYFPKGYADARLFSEDE